jgi:hypothetical protein
VHGYEQTEAQLWFRSVLHSKISKEEKYAEDTMVILLLTACMTCNFYLYNVPVLVIQDTTHHMLIAIISPDNDHITAKTRSVFFCEIILLLLLFCYYWAFI